MSQLLSLTYFSHLSIRTHTCLCPTVIAGLLQVMVEQLTFLPSFCYDFFFFCRCCHVMSLKRRCSVAEDVRAHSLLGVVDHGLIDIRPLSYLTYLPTSLSIIIIVLDDFFSKCLFIEWFMIYDSNMTNCVFICRIVYSSIYHHSIISSYLSFNHIIIYRIVY